MIPNTPTVQQHMVILMSHQGVWQSNWTRIKAFADVDAHPGDGIDVWIETLGVGGSSFLLEATWSHPFGGSLMWGLHLRQSAHVQVPQGLH